MHSREASDEAFLAVVGVDPQRFLVELFHADNSKVRMRSACMLWFWGMTHLANSIFAVENTDEFGYSFE